jgi:thiol-disulfide isomerase/thioredoxin
MLRMDQQLGRPVLIEFWDFCRPNSIRTLPYLKAWHERYEAAGLRVIGVHSAGFGPADDPQQVSAAVERLGIEYPVVIDFEYHFGEGGYRDTELAIQELLGTPREPLAPVRPEDAPGAALIPQSEDVPGPYSGPYQAGGVWAVLDGAGTITVNGNQLSIDHPGAYELISHEYSTEGVLDLSLGGDVECLAVCFTPGLGRA